MSTRPSPTAGFYRHQRLSNERDSIFFETGGNYAEQWKKLQEIRQEAIAEVYSDGGLEAVLAFTQQVDSPVYVGLALGATETAELEPTLLASLLLEYLKPLSLFIGSYINARFRLKGWNWIDALAFSTWQPEPIGQLFANLPFSSDTWDRIGKLLSDNESIYWSKTNVNPYQAGQKLSWAIDRLVEYNRAYDAVYCIWYINHEKLPLDVKQAIKVLVAVSQSSQTANTMDAHYVVEVIKALQDNIETKPDDMYLVE